MLFKTIQNTYIGRSFKTLHCIFIGRSFKTLHSTYKGRSLKTLHNTYKGSSFKTLHCTYIGRSFKTIHNTYLGKTLYIVSRSSWALTVAQLSAVRIGSSISISSITWIEKTKNVLWFAIAIKYLGTLVGVHWSVPSLPSPVIPVWILLKTGRVWGEKWPKFSKHTAWLGTFKRILERW